MDKSRVYVLGTGASLLDLTKEERETIAASGKVLSINRYYLYHEKISIKPTSVIIADFNYYADIILRNTLEKSVRDSDPPKIYTNADYHRLYSNHVIRDRLFKRQARKMLYRRYGYKPSISLPGLATTTPIHVANESPGFHWASTLSETLYHRRGTLTTALNLASVLYPNHDVMLLGIDLSSPKYFYDEAITSETADAWVDEKYATSLTEGTHANARPKSHDTTTLVDAMRFVVEEMRARHMAVFNVNAQSLLVTENVTPWRPVL